MKKLQLLSLMLVLSGLAIGASAQDTIKGLIISEHRFGDPSWGYIELANMGTETVDLSNVSIAQITNQTLVWDVDQWRLTLPLAENVQVHPEGMLAPGETWLVMAVSDNWNPQLGEGYPYHRPDMLPLADMYIHHADVFGVIDTIIPEWQMWADSASVNAGFMWNWGSKPFVLFNHLDNGDSIMIDQVRMAINESNVAWNGTVEVAGIPDATRYSTLVRKANITQGNMDWVEAAGISVEDSEWIPIPNQPFRSMPSFKTIKNHGDYHIDVTSSAVDVDMENEKMSVPWGIYKGDSILQHLDLGPNMAWAYILDANFEDSTYSTVREGDTLVLYAAGNTLEEVHFAIDIKDPVIDIAEVFPISHKVNGGLWFNEPQAQWQLTTDPIWFQPYYVTNFHAMDTIGNVPYATRVDTLYKYLEKAPKATWEIVFLDGEDHADLSKGDILKVTAEDGSTVKEYYIDVQGYAPNDDATLGAITWPDKPDFMEGWAEDTIPYFSSAKLIYNVKVPFGNTNVPALVANLSDVNAKVDVKRAISLTGSSEDRSTVFTVTAEDGSTVQTYTVLFNLEKHPTKIQNWDATPFFSESATNQRTNLSWLEIVNPGIDPMDLSEYFIVRSDLVNPAEAIEALAWDDVPPTDADFQNRYMTYVPGYQYYEDTATWLLNPGILNLDADVNPTVQPGGVFVMTASHDNRLEFITDYQWSVINKIWSPGLEDEGINWATTVPHLPRGTDALYLFKIVGDSVLDGTKPVGDPADFELVDVLGDPIADDIWTVAGEALGAVHRGAILPKPYLYTGSRSLVECEQRWGTSVDTTDWIKKTWKADPDVPNQDNISDLIGSHDMDPVVFYISTVTSGVYLVSDGFGMEETIQGDLTSTTVGTFKSYLDTIPGQMLSVLSGVDGSMKDLSAAVAGGDTLVVLSQDGMNTTKYELIDIPLDDNAVLTLVDDPSNYEITIDGSTGTISGVVFGGLLKDVFAAVKVPELAVMNIINGAGELVPLLKSQSDSVKVDAKVGDDIYFEVIAQDLVTIINYKLEPATLSSDAYVISSIYTVDDEKDEISGIEDGSSVDLLFRNVEVVVGATATIMNKSGDERLDGVTYYDDVLKVVSEDGTNSTVYFLTFKGESNPDVNEAPVVTLAFSDSILYETGTILLSATADDDDLPAPPALTYLWEVSSGSAADVVIETPDQLETNVTFNAMGDYTLTLSVSDGAAKTEAAVNVSLRGVNVPQMLAPAMHIYPNPAKDRLTLEIQNMPGYSAVITLYNITGNAVYNAKLSAEKTEIDLSSFQAGLYFLKLESDNLRLTQRIEIQK